MSRAQRWLNLTGRQLGVLMALPLSLALAYLAVFCIDGHPIAGLIVLGVVVVAEATMFCLAFLLDVRDERRRA